MEKSLFAYLLRLGPVAVSQLKVTVFGISNVFLSFSICSPVRLNVLAFIFLVVGHQAVKSQPVKQWDKIIGTDISDEFTCMQQTPDGGYIIGANSRSNINRDKTEDSKGDNDFWIIKLAADGTIEWDKTIGGGSGEFRAEAAVDCVAVFRAG